MTRVLFVVLAFAGAAALATEPVHACKKHQAKGPCTTEEFDFERIEKACEESGRKGAASAMRMMMLRANQKRAGLKCASCHADPDEGQYALKPDARSLAKTHFVVEETSR